MKVREIKKLMVAGLSVTTNNDNEKEESTAKIPTLWDDYLEKGIYQKTFDKSDKNAMYAVYRNYEDADKGNYEVTVAVEVKKPKKAIVIENQRYLVFSKKGELPNVVFDAWTDINEYFAGDAEYTRAFTIDFEKYVNEDEIEIYISIL